MHGDAAGSMMKAPRLTLTSNQAPPASPTDSQQLPHFFAVRRFANRNFASSQVAAYFCVAPFDCGIKARSFPPLLTIPQPSNKADYSSDYRDQDYAAAAWIPNAQSCILKNSCFPP